MKENGDEGRTDVRRERMVLEQQTAATPKNCMAAKRARQSTVGLGMCTATMLWTLGMFNVGEKQKEGRGGGTTYKSTSERSIERRPT
jgi:hypothetical protein